MAFVTLINNSIIQDICQLGLTFRLSNKESIQVAYSILLDLEEPDKNKTSNDKEKICNVVNIKTNLNNSINNNIQMNITSKFELVIAFLLYKDRNQNFENLLESILMSNMLTTQHTNLIDGSNWISLLLSSLGILTKNSNKVKINSYCRHQIFNFSRLINVNLSDLNNVRGEIKDDWCYYKKEIESMELNSSNVTIDQKIDGLFNELGANLDSFFNISNESWKKNNFNKKIIKLNSRTINDDILIKKVKNEANEEKIENKIDEVYNQIKNKNKENIVRNIQNETIYSNQDYVNQNIRKDVFKGTFYEFKSILSNYLSDKILISHVDLFNISQDNFKLDIVRNDNSINMDELLIKKLSELNLFDDNIDITMNKNKIFQCSYIQKNNRKAKSGILHIKNPNYLDIDLTRNSIGSNLQLKNYSISSLSGHTLELNNKDLLLSIMPGVKAFHYGCLRVSNYDEAIKVDRIFMPWYKVQEHMIEYSTKINRLQNLLEIIHG